MDKIKCPYCHKIPKVPVRIRAGQCNCKNKAILCYTCFRNELGFTRNINGGREKQSKKVICTSCNSPISHLDSNGNLIRAGKIYVVDKKAIEDLDKYYGRIQCPKNCGWVGWRNNALKHYSSCSKGNKFRCKGCNKYYSRNDIIEHLKRNKECCENYHDCCGCIYLSQKRYDDHIRNCPKAIACELCEIKFSKETIPIHTINCIYKIIGRKLIIEKENIYDSDGNKPIVYGRNCTIDKDKRKDITFVMELIMNICIKYIQRVKGVEIVGSLQSKFNIEWVPRGSFYKVIQIEGKKGLCEKVVAFNPYDLMDGWECNL